LLGIKKSNTRAVSVTVNYGPANVSAITSCGFQAAYSDGFANVIDILNVCAGMHQNSIPIAGSMYGTLNAGKSLRPIQRDMQSSSSKGKRQKKQKGYNSSHVVLTPLLNQMILGSNI
jgi:hypothetical protein